jgi:hypothetical protein
MNKYFNFLYACVAAALIISFFTIGVPNSNALMASIVCYYLAAAAILMLASISMSNVRDLYSGILQIRPFLSIFTILLFSAIMMNVYFNQISGNKVSSYYYTFSKVSVILLLVQIAVFFHSIFGQNVLTRKTTSILGLLATINIITLLTLGITLKYYTTDC